MRMPDLRHAPFQVAVLPLKIEVEGRTEPDALGHTECLLQDAFVERLELKEALAKARLGGWPKGLGHEQTCRSGTHDRARHLPALHHHAKQAGLLGVESPAQ